MRVLVGYIVFFSTVSAGNVVCCISKNMFFLDPDGGKYPWILKLLLSIWMAPC